MAIAYSEDLRIRALSLRDQEKSISEISRLLEISRPTLYRWIRQWETTGTTAPIKSVPPPQESKIQDWQQFREFVDANNDKTQTELAQLWGGGVTNHVISRGLRKIGYTRKKNDKVPRAM